MPKHLLDLLGERTLIRETVDRIAPLVPAEQILIVTERNQAPELIRQLPEIPVENIIIEPVGRNTAPCIGLAALHIRARGSDDVMLVLPADQSIGEETAFRQVITAAGAAAATGDSLVTIGIRPTGPETGYGYLEQGDFFSTIGGKGIYRIRSFREKPPRKQAEQFLAQGGFYWNSGMFAWRASTILQAIARFLPELHAGLMQIGEALGTDREEEVVMAIYAGLKAVSIDYGVMEKAGETLLIPGDFGWSDLGSWDALWEASGKDENGNACRGRVIGIEAGRSLVYSPKKLVALIGVDDLLVIETDDALLICKRGRSQDVRKLTERLAKERLTDLL
jgi:mannose-1-phosphate guanylyltransferase